MMFLIEVIGLILLGVLSVGIFLAGVILSCECLKYLTKKMDALCANEVIAQIRIGVIICATIFMFLFCMYMLGETVAKGLEVLCANPRVLLT